jgi:hypothetical protein
MLSNLLEIFSDNSDKARIIAIVVSSFVAITVVFINQWLVARKESRRYLVEKIEEISKLISTFERGTMDFIRDLDYKAAPDDSYGKALEAAQDIQILTSLYFSSYKFPTAEQLRAQTLDNKNEVEVERVGEDTYTLKCALTVEKATSKQEVLVLELRYLSHKLIKKYA